MKNKLHLILYGAIIYLAATIMLFAIGTMLVKSYDGFGYVGMFSNSALIVGMFYAHGFIESRRSKK